MKLPIYLFAGICMILSGCASSTRGADQRVMVSTPGAPGALCRLSAGAQESQVFTTPEAIRIPRTSGPITITCQKKCYYTEEKAFAPSINSSEMDRYGLVNDVDFFTVNLITQKSNNFDYDFILPMRRDNRCRKIGKSYLDGEANDFDNQIDDFSFSPNFPDRIRSRPDLEFPQDKVPLVQKNQK